MSRRATLAGLPPYAERYLQAMQAKVVAKLKLDDGFYGEHILYTYRLKDGSVVSEVEQKKRGSSGPTIFLKLIKQPTCEDLYTWTEEEIEDNI